MEESGEALGGAVEEKVMRLSRRLGLVVMPQNEGAQARYFCETLGMAPKAISGSCAVVRIVGPTCGESCPLGAMNAQDTVEALQYIRPAGVMA